MRRNNVIFVLLFIIIAGTTTWTVNRFQSTSFSFFRSSSNKPRLSVPIGIVDIAAIKNNSKVFQEFNNNLEGLMAKIHKEILERETKLHSEFEAFKKNEESAKQPTRESLKQKAELDRKVSELEKIVRARKEALDKEITSRLIIIKQTLKLIISDLAKSYGLSIILNNSLGESNQMDQSIILFSKEGLDLTDEVVKQLDKQLLAE